MRAEELRMPDMLKIAAIEGNGVELKRLLGLKEEQSVPDHAAVTIDHTDTTPTLMEGAKKIAVCKLQSVTNFGDTILHILVTHGHNELAYVIFENDRSLLKVTNKMGETPLHYTAKVGNKEVIIKLSQVPNPEVKDAVRITNCQGETALYVAAKHGHEGVVGELMQLDPEGAYEVNNEGLPPLYIATNGGYTSTVKTMLQKDARLAKVRFSNGSFPVHVAARMGNTELVMHFMQEYPDSANLKDPRGRNIFHIAAEENNKKLLPEGNARVSRVVDAMVNAPDFEGNTPLHIAAMKGDPNFLCAIWRVVRCHKETLTAHNNNGQTAFELSEIQVKDTKPDTRESIEEYVKDRGHCFTSRWFNDIMKLSVQEKMEMAQTIGLGSALIATVAFTVAFTLPGGLNQDKGTPIFGRKYMFRVFIMANTLAFLQAFTSLVIMVSEASMSLTANIISLNFARSIFFSAGGSMVLAFGFGSYVMLAPVSMPIAILILVATLLVGSPIMVLIAIGGRNLHKLFVYKQFTDKTELSPGIIVYVVPLVFIFCLGFL